MWQAIYNDSYVEPMNAIEQTFTIEVGQLIDEGSRMCLFLCGAFVMLTDCST